VLLCEKKWCRKSRKVILLKSDLSHIWFWKLQVKCGIALDLKSDEQHNTEHQVSWPNASIR